MIGVNRSPGDMPGETIFPRKQGHIPTEAYEPQPATWADSPDAAFAHRSAAAGPVQAALLLENNDPHTSVTFVTVASSGATILEGLIGRQTRWTEDEGGAALGQIEQVKRIIGNRQIDALTISVGGNDIGFEKIASSLVAGPIADLKETYFGDQTADVLGKAVADFIAPIAADPSKFNLGTLAVDYLRARWNDELGRTFAARRNDGKDTLPQLYDKLDQRLEQRGPLGLGDNLNAASNVFITEYPFPGLERGPDPAGTASGAILGDIIPGLSADKAELEWARKTALEPLNGAIKAAAGRNGWRFVGDIVEAFKGHGYSAADGDRWIRTAAESRDLQGPYTYPDEIVNVSRTLGEELGGAGETVGDGFDSTIGELVGLGVHELVAMYERAVTKGTLHPNQAGHRAIGQILNRALVTFRAPDPSNPIIATAHNDLTVWNATAAPGTITVEFSKPVDPNTVVYGDTVRVTGRWGEDLGGSVRVLPGGTKIEVRYPPPTNGGFGLVVRGVKDYFGGALTVRDGRGTRPDYVLADFAGPKVESVEVVSRTTIRVRFNEVVNATTVTPGAFRFAYTPPAAGPGGKPLAGPITVTAAPGGGGREFDINFVGGLPRGGLDLTVKAYSVTDAYGNVAEQDDFRSLRDSRGPMVHAFKPPVFNTNGGLAPANGRGTVSTLLAFGEGIDAATFGASDVQIKGPDGIATFALSVTARPDIPAYDPAGRVLPKGAVWAVTFEARGWGDYGVSVGPDLGDYFGNWMDQDQDDRIGYLLGQAAEVGQDTYTFTTPLSAPPPYNPKAPVTPVDKLLRERDWAFLAPPGGLPPKGPNRVPVTLPDPGPANKAQVQPFAPALPPADFAKTAAAVVNGKEPAPGIDTTIPLGRKKL